MLTKLWLMKCVLHSSEIHTCVCKKEILFLASETNDSVIKNICYNFPTQALNIERIFPFGHYHHWSVWIKSEV